MIETDEEGNRQIRELINQRHDPIFNDWEQNFIRDLMGQRYEMLSKAQKACITRLIGWLKGDL